MSFRAVRSWVVENWGSGLVGVLNLRCVLFPVRSWEWGGVGVVLCPRASRLTTSRHGQDLGQNTQMACTGVMGAQGMWWNGPVRHYQRGDT